MTTRELRRKYLEFFETKGHTIFPSGSLVPYDVTGRLDDSLLFNGAGMIQFKPYFRGVAEPPNPRLTTCQKCVRTGDIDEVGDASHLTFFEMLGNFSFGDYFKDEAIAYSWEFLTGSQWLSLDPSRLSFTVFEEDDAALQQWSDCLSSVGLDAKSRVCKLGEETNYWPAGAFSKGPPGPCGPNSEMFYWVPKDELPPSGAYTKEDWLRDESQGKWLEIWNDVFIQFEWRGAPRDPQDPSKGFVKEGLENLPFRSIDTGMGLERTAAVLGGLASVYDTDAFTPIFARIRALTGAALETSIQAERVIADHIRTACFCIADGILPGNSGRGYVLRRLIRRAILKGDRNLGLKEPFLYKTYEGVVEAMGDHYAELTERKDTIIETLRGEEELFRRTLREGSVRLFEAMDRTRKLEDVSNTAASLGAGLQPTPLQLPGAVAFQLHDTYGFPLEVTRELCEEAGLTVDLAGYEAALKEAQERSRGASGMGTVYGGVGIGITFLTKDTQGPTPTRFVGYTHSAAHAQIVGVVAVPSEDGLSSAEFAIALDQTPFYAESGGQLADTGTIRGEGFELTVLDVTKQEGVFVHLVEAVRLDPPLAWQRLPLDRAGQLLMDRLYGVQVLAEMDTQRRRKITRNHTATHLLHAALRRVLGGHVTQAGSQVRPDALRFDFTHGKALSPAELQEVERLVNQEALKGAHVTTYADVPLAEAKKLGAMALFGEKYGERVRVVEIRENPSVEAFSIELCGGCHVQNTAEIGLFKVVHESSAASGIRRIEALTGEGAYDWVNRQAEMLHEAAQKLKSPAPDLLGAIDRTLEQLREERRKVEKLRTQGAGAVEPSIVPVGPLHLATLILNDGEPKDATAAADRLTDGHPDRVALIGLVAEGKITLVCKVGTAAQAAGAHAGNLVREVAKLVGGGGGGRPDFATAGGKEPEKLSSAMAQAKSLVQALLK